MNLTRISLFFPSTQILTICLIFFFITDSNCQGQINIHENQQWLQYVNNIQVKSKWAIRSNASLRWVEDFSKLAQYQLSSGLGYRFTENFRFSSGISYFRPINNSSLTHHEIRPFQELSFNNDIGKTRMVNRLRIEERFLTFGEVEKSQTTYFRFRYGLFFSVPVSEFSKNSKTSNLEIALRNEVLFNGPNDQDEKMFDLNRLSIGPSWAMEHISLTLFWHNQFSSLPEYKSYKYTTIFALQVLQRLTL